MKEKPSLEALRWRKVEVPKPWQPEAVGDTLIGYYLGQTVRDGRYSTYKVAIVLVPGVGALLVTGTQVIQMIDASGCCRGEPIKIEWGGMKVLASGHSMKTYTVWVEAGHRLDEAEIPTVEGYEA